MREFGEIGVVIRGSWALGVWEKFLIWGKVVKRVSGSE